MPETLLWLLVAGLGGCVGSFLNVCIHRLPRRASIVTPRSACPRCGSGIAWFDNIPLVSWLILRGRCRRCGGSISMRYPLVEVATMLLFLLLFHARGATPAFLVQALFGASLIALILIDAEHQILPNAITLPGIAVGLLVSPWRDGGDPFRTGEAFTSFRDAAAAAAIGYAIPWSVNLAYRIWQMARGVPAAQREDGIGQGDFKLLAMIGAFLGLRLLLFCLFFGALSGAIFGLAMIRFAGYGWKSKLPYGVFLGGAALLSLFVGEPWIAWYLRLAGVAP